MTDIKEIIDSRESMSLPGIKSGRGNFRIGDPGQYKLYSQLLKYNIDAANSYYGSLFTLEAKDNPDRYKQAAHSIRLISALITRDVSAEVYNDNRTVTQMTIDWLSEYDDLKLPTSVEITEFKKRLQNFTLNHIKKMMELIKRDDPKGGPPEFILKQMAERWNKSHGYFNNVSKTGITTEPDFRQNLSIVEDMLLNITSSYYDNRDAIKRILDQEPSLDLALNLRNLINSYRSYEFLFQTASVEWLLPLSRANFFEAPDNDTREWPPSKYLIRVTKEKPEDVIKIVEAISNATSPAVMSDIINIALSLEPKLSISIITIMRKGQWLKNGYLGNYWFGHNAIKLIDHLAGGGEIAAAMGLFSHLLKFEFTEGASSFRSTKSLIREYDYQELLEKNIEQLFSLDPVDVINIIARKLNATYIKFYDVNKIYLKDEDYSYLDYKDIDDHMDYSHGARRMLLRSLSNRIEQLGKTSPDKLAEAIDKLDYPVFIFRMIKLRIYNNFNSLFTQEIRTALFDATNYDEFDDLGMPFVELLQTNFKLLDENGRKIIFAIVDKCPDHISNLKDTEQKEKDEWYERWKYRVLFPIQEYLDKDHKEWFLALSPGLGKPEYERGRIISWSGPTSDLSVEDFNTMEPDKIVEELAKWEPPKGFGVDSPEGRGRNLSESIKQLPDKYFKTASLFIDNRLSFTYINHLFWGFELAKRDGRKLNWDSIIDAAVKFVSLNPEEISRFPEKSEDFDYDYDGVLKAVVSLIDQGFNTTEVDIPTARREDVWNIIIKGLLSSNPDLKHEKEYGGNNMDPYTMSINTTRGEAMHALIRYSSWVSNTINKKMGLTDEVMDRLIFHLNYDNDPTETIHCLYGFYFPFLYYHEKDWVISNLKLIFPEEESRFLIWKAAFGAYLYRGMYVDFFPLLANQYKRGIKYVDEVDEKDNSRDSFTDNLAHHIMLAVAHGTDGAHDIAELMFKSGNNKLVQHAVFFAGANIIKPELGKIKDEKLPDPDKLKWIWESMLEKISPEAAKGFGWWFVNSPYDKDFTIKQLIKTLKVTGGHLDAEHKMNDELNKYVEEFPNEVIECAEQIVKGDIHGWHLSFKIDDYVNLFKAALKNASPELKEKISQLSDYLGKKGYDNFEEFINKQ